MDSPARSPDGRETDGAVIRTAHGTGASALVRAETRPLDEQPVGVPADARSDSPTDRGEGGRFAPGNSLAVEGGKARAGKTRLADRLGLAKLPEGAAFAPYRKAAASFRRAHCAELARTRGGGVCGSGPSSMVATAALALAWSRYFSDRAAETGDADLAVKAIALGDKSRQALLTAGDMCATEAEARAKSAPPIDPLARWRTPQNGGSKP